MISKTHISGQKLRGRQLNSKVCDSKSAIFRILSFLLRLLFKQRYLAKCLSTHRHFSTKLMLITAQSSTTTQRLHSFKFILVNKSHSQHSETAVRCLGRHFLILYACAHKVSFPDQRPRSLVWKREYTSERAWLTRSFSPAALGKAYEHHVGKALHSAVYL